jgi:putative transposase
MLTADPSHPLHRAHPSSTLLHATSAHSGFAERARILPAHPPWRTHRFPPRSDRRSAQQFVTLILADALPKKAITRMEHELATLPEIERAALRRRRLHGVLDAGNGSCRLLDPRQAALVEQVLRHGDGERYRLLAWVVMPNHVHALIEPLPGWAPERIVHAWKSLTAHVLAKGADGAPPLRSGRRLWLREFWERRISDAQHYRQALDYIHLDPVKAGLAEHPGAWRWSSAHHPASAPSRPPQPCP